LGIFAIESVAAIVVEPDGFAFLIEELSLTRVDAAIVVVAVFTTAPGILFAIAVAIAGIEAGIACVVLRRIVPRVGLVDTPIARGSGIRCIGRTFAGCTTAPRGTAGTSALP
jgi:hypothetical protein